MKKKIQGVRVQTLKMRLDKWLNMVPDKPKSENYAKCAAAESNKSKAWYW